MKIRLNPFAEPRWHAAPSSFPLCQQGRQTMYEANPASYFSTNIIPDTAGVTGAGPVSFVVL